MPRDDDVDSSPQPPDDTTQVFGGTQQVLDDTTQVFGDTTQVFDDTTQVLPVGPTLHLAEGGRGHAAPPGTLLNEFELIRVIGEGGFGIVYEAKDRVLLRHVAVKEYMPASLASRKDQTQVEVRSQLHQDAFDQGMRSFVNEARLLVRFDHPSLVKAYRFWEANGTAYMVMPLYRGATLKQRLKLLSKPPTEEWLMALLDPLTEALHALHVENCFHRDIAPDNILLLEEDERPVLLDFGAARQVIGDMTQSLTVILKPGFAPVEQYATSPEMVQGPWTDAYALAATMHFAIKGSTPPSSVGRLVKDSYVPLAGANIEGYSRQFLAALDRALGVLPRDRTASMVEFRADLGLAPLGLRTVTMSRTVLENHKSGPSARSLTATLRTHSRRLAAIGGLAILAIGAAGIALWQGSTNKPSGMASAQPQIAPPVPAPPVVSAATEGPVIAAPVAVAPVAVAPVVSAPVAAAPIPVDMSTQFQRIVADQTPEFVVTATASKAVLKIGKDRFGWQIRSTRDGFVQILGLGPDGTLLLLFPNSQDRNHRIRAGQVLNLPRNSWPLEAAEPVGREELLVIVSAQARAFDGVSTERSSYFLQLPTGDAAAAVQSRWPHQTPWLLGAVSNCAAKGCDDYGAATVAVEVRH